MPQHTTEDIRNIALTGHAGSGKTTLVEALLAEAGAIGSPGSVEKGDTACDFEPEEKAHGHSLSSAVVSLDHGGHRVHLIDTPGLPDLIGHAYAAFPAVEAVAVAIDATGGIEAVARRMMERAAERALPRCIIINKIDAEGVNPAALVERIRETFGPICLPINLPAGGGKRVLDVFDRADSSEASTDFSSVSEAHERIIDQVVEVDETLMTEYLEGGQVDPSRLHEPFEKCLREAHLVPICFTSAREGVGIAEVLDGFARLMPSPAEGNPHPFEHGEGEHVEPLKYTPDPEKHVIAHVFKIATDPFVGQLSVFRIHQGTVKPGGQLYIGDAKKPFKVAHLFTLHGGEHQEVDAGIPGDICAVAKVEGIHFNDVLHDSPAHGHVHLRPFPFPVPMAGYAITAKSRGDEAKLSKALHAMEAEDPCFRVESAEGGETVIRGLGEMHLRIMLERMAHRYHVEVETRPPRIAYRETIRGRGDGHHRHKKQTGGAGQFGEVFLRVEPLDDATGFEFANDIFGGAIPQQFIPAIEKGVRQVMEEGCVAGYPMRDIRVRVYDGKYHSVDSKEVAFVAAARRAFIDAVGKAEPTLLEPIAAMEITVPEANMGDVAGDLSGKRGRIMGTDTLPGGMLVIRATAPLGELGQYANQLKSMSGGQGGFSMEFSHYDPVPAHVQRELAEQYRPKEEVA